MHEISEDTLIFSIGVFLKPEYAKINGKSQWRWIAVGFEDTSFDNGEEIDVYEYADTIEGLLRNEDLIKPEFNT